MLPGKLANKIDEFIHRFIDGFQCRHKHQSFFYLFSLSAMVWLLDVSAIYVLLEAFGFTLPVISDVMIYSSPVLRFPTAPGYIGTWH